MSNSEPAEKDGVSYANLVDPLFQKSESSVVHVKDITTIDQFLIQEKFPPDGWGEVLKDEIVCKFSNIKSRSLNFLADKALPRLRRGVDNSSPYNKKLFVIGSAVRDAFGDMLEAGQLDFQKGEGQGPGEQSLHNLMRDSVVERVQSLFQKGRIDDVLDIYKKYGEDKYRCIFSGCFDGLLEMPLDANPQGKIDIVRDFYQRSPEELFTKRNILDTFMVGLRNKAAFDKGATPHIPPYFQHLAEWGRTLRGETFPDGENGCFLIAAWMCEIGAICLQTAETREQLSADYAAYMSHIDPEYLKAADPAYTLLGHFRGYVNSGTVYGERYRMLREWVAQVEQRPEAERRPHQPRGTTLG